jgi:hypothetical protein
MARQAPIHALSGVPTGELQMKKVLLAVSVSALLSGVVLAQVRDWRDLEADRHQGNEGKERERH